MALMLLRMFHRSHGHLTMFYDEALKGEFVAFAVKKKMHVSLMNGTREHPLGELRTTCRCDMAAKMLGDCTLNHITTAESV